MNEDCFGWNPIWENIFREREWTKYPDIFLVRFMARNYYNRDRKNIKVLEIGSGTGAGIWYLAREGFDTYGIEGSVTGVQKTLERLKRNKLKATVEVGDFIKIDYPNEFFDVVVDNASLQHNSWEAINLTLKEVKRVLKVGGRFIGRLVREDLNLTEGYGTIHYFTKKDIKELFDGWKLKMEKSGYEDNGNLHEDWIVEGEKRK